MKRGGRSGGRSAVVVTLLLAVVISTVGWLVLSSGVVTPRDPADAAVGWADRLVGVPASGGHPARRRRGAAHRTRHRTYRVRAGDTLARVSRRTGLTVRDLRALNRGLDPLNLHRGQVLRLRG